MIKYDNTPSMINHTYKCNFCTIIIGSHLHNCNMRIGTYLDQKQAIEGIENLSKFSSSYKNMLMISH